MEHIDPDTGKNHIAPKGLEKQGPNKSKNNIYYCNVKMRHHIIKAHQDAYPDLAERMKNNPNASNVYAAFLAIMPLQAKGKLTPEIQQEILKTFKLI